MNRTLRGQFIEGTNNRLIVDDGRLNHGYKVVRFVVSGYPDSSANDAFAVLSLDSDTSKVWNWGDNRQIAWSATAIDGTGGAKGSFELIDPDHVVLQDLWVQGQVSASGGTSAINYFVELEPITLTDDQAIITLIKERSQDDL